MNEETFNYCLKKLHILLYGQQYYARKSDLWFVNKNTIDQEINLKFEFKDCTYSEYIIKKVKAEASKYGLIFFDDEETMNKIYSYCNIVNKQKIGFKV